MGQNHGGTKTKNTGALRYLPPRRDLWKTNATSTNVSDTKDDAGKRSAVKVACCVWRGTVREGLATVPRWLAYPTTIHELLARGKSIRTIAATLELSRNTVRKYLHGTAAPEASPRSRRKRGSKLDAFKAQIEQWIKEEHLYNCATMLPRLRSMGYTGSGTLLRGFVNDLRPPTQGHHPVRRYETEPGEQLQFDWAEFRYEREGVPKKLYGFTAVLSYSRMRYVTFVKRCDAATLIRCLMEGFEYMGGLPKAALTDRMKTVLLDMDGKTPIWHPRFADFMASIGVSPRVCKSYTPQTKGTVESLFRWMTQRFEKRLPNTSYGVHDAETAAQAGGMTLEALERCFYQAIVDDYQQAFDDLRRQRPSVLWELAVAQSGVPQYLGSPDDLKLLLMKAQNRKTPHHGYRTSSCNRLSFQGRWYVCPGLLSRLAGRGFDVFYDRRDVGVLDIFV